MADRYVNVDMLLRHMEQYEAGCVGKEWLKNWADNHSVNTPPPLENTPTPSENTPPTPTIQAEWILGTYAEGCEKKQYICSNCRTPYRLLDEVVGTKYAPMLYMIEGTQFCPSCGAKMGERGGEL